MTRMAEVSHLPAQSIPMAVGCKLSQPMTTSTRMVDAAPRLLDRP